MTSCGTIHPIIFMFSSTFQKLEITTYWFYHFGSMLLCDLVCVQKRELLNSLLWRMFDPKQKEITDVNKLYN